jgi:hypothetical protein
MTSMMLPETHATPEGPKVEGASASLLKRLLTLLEAELVKQGVPVAEYMSPGARKSEVEAAFGKCGLVPPDEAIVWFGWHNGPTGEGNSERVFPRFNFWSLEDCVRDYLEPGGQPKGYGPRLWNPDWINLMGDGNGVALDCGKPASHPPLVRALSLGREFGTQAGEIGNQVVSLCTPVTWWIDAFRRGWYQWDREQTGWDWENGPPDALGTIWESYGLS